MLINQFKPKSFLFLWLAAFCLNIIAFLFIAFKNGFKADTLALKFNIKAGVLWFGPSANLYFLPSLALAICALNVFLCYRLSNSEVFLRWLILIASLIVQALLVLGLIFLGGVN